MDYRKTTDVYRCLCTDGKDSDQETMGLQLNTAALCLLYPCSFEYQVLEGKTKAATKLFHRPREGVLMAVTYPCLNQKQPYCPLSDQKKQKPAEGQMP